LLLGDSNASGLAAYWSSEGTKYGNPTASKPKGGTGAVYWRDKVSPLMSSLRPGVVVMSLGGNDYHTNTRAVKDGIVQIVKAIREAGVEFVWLDGPEFPFEDTAGIRQAWLDAIATYGGYQFDGRGRGLPHRSDKIHLTAEGYQSLASMLWTFMSDKGLLRKP
jgi:lysophospholipase L1-like esterase